MQCSVCPEQASKKPSRRVLFRQNITLIVPLMLCQRFDRGMRQDYGMMTVRFFNRYIPLDNGNAERWHSMRGAMGVIF